MSKKNISIIIPCYASEKYLKKTVSEILAVFSAENIPSFIPDHEMSLRIILVNDSSPDNTFSVIRELVQTFPKEIIGIDLAGNVGQARAKMAGLPYADGDYTVFMDDDGQHDPKTIFKMMRAVDHGYDLVYARFPALKETPFRRLGSGILDVLMGIFAAKPRSLRITSFFALSPAAVSALGKYDCLHPFIGAYLLSRRGGRDVQRSHGGKFSEGQRSSGGKFGDGKLCCKVRFRDVNAHGGIQRSEPGRYFRVCTVSSSHRQRSVGKSGYTMKKLARRALELCVLWRLPRKKSEAPMYEVRTVLCSPGIHSLL